MSTPKRPMLLVDLCAPSPAAPRWAELGYDVQSIDSALLDACEAEPTALEQHLHTLFAQALKLLVVACDRLPIQRAADVADWQPVLHQPLARCFTALRGLAPRVCAHPRGGHIVALLNRAALLPEVKQGSAAILGRSLLGLFEALRAELRQTSARVTLCITDADEAPAVFEARLRCLLDDKPFYSLPASIDERSLMQYFTPLEEALARTPLGMPLPAGPQGEVYRSSADLVGRV